jgi:hypothetical protein
MDPKPPPAPGTLRGGTRRPVRRRHPAARSRVVAGVLSAVLFLGLGAGMATNQAVTPASSSTVSSQDDTGSSSSSWAATPGSASDQSPMTSSQGS